MKRMALLLLLFAPIAEAQIKQITGGGYQNSNGVACAGCILFLQLPVDATVSGTGQIVPNINSYQLDANGNVPANSNLWANDQLTPSGLTYKATLTNAGGGRIWGPEFLSITGVSPISLTQLVPVASSSVFFGNPAVLNVANNFTALQTFSAGLTCLAPCTLALPLNLQGSGFTNQLAGTMTTARTWTLQDASDTFVYRSTTDILSNKTVDITANTLKTSTNTAGHVPRNNGTQYVDGQLAASDLSNGVTGSGAIVLTTTPTIATPVINGASSGTGIQGTDTKLLTSGTVSGTAAFLCTDTNGGATTSGCAFVTIKTATAAGCTTGTANGATCTTTVNWATNFPDTNYKVTCQGTGTITGYPFNIGLSKAVGSVTVTTSNGAAAQAVASSNANIECIGVE